LEAREDIMPTRLALMRDQVRYQPGSADAVFELAYEYFRLRNYNDAAIGFKRVLLTRPNEDMLVLRELCARGRAAPPSALAALFCTTGSAPSRPRTRRNPRVAPLPTPIFWHVLSYWRSDRDFDPSAA
jgi:hypothetical protein